MTKGLYIEYEMLNIQSVATLPDRLWRRLLELQLIREYYEDDTFGDIFAIAWTLRQDEETIREDIQQLETLGFIKTNGDTVLQSTDADFVKGDIGYVYFLKNSHLIKIGMTNDLSRRKGQLEYEVGSKLDLLFYIYTKRYRELEKELHRKFSTKRDHGEWFNLDEYDIEFIRTHYEVCLEYHT